MAETISLQLSNLCHDGETVAFGGVDALNERLQAIQGNDPGAGYPGGHVVTPTRSIARSLAQQIDNKKFNNDLGDGRVAFSGTEQSWGPGLPEGLGRASRNLTRPAKAMIEVALSAMMTESEDSLEIMQKMDKSFGQPLAVVRAEIRGRDDNFIDFTKYRFRRTGVQVKPALYTALSGAVPDSNGSIKPTLEQQALLHRNFFRMGVDGLVLDGHWAQAEAEGMKGVRLHPDTWESSSSGFDAYTSESDTGIPIVGIHAAAGRSDSKNPDDKKRSAKELAAVLKGPEAIRDTALGGIMMRGYNIWRVQLRKAWFGLNLEPYDRVRHVTEDDLEQLFNPYLKARHIKHGAERTMLSIKSPARLPVTVEITNQGLKQYREDRAASRMTPKDSALMLRDAAQHLGAFFTELESEWGWDTTRAEAARRLTSLGRPHNAL